MTNHITKINKQVLLVGTLNKHNRRQPVISTTEVHHQMIQNTRIRVSRDKLLLELGRAQEKVWKGIEAFWVQWVKLRWAQVLAPFWLGFSVVKQNTIHTSTFPFRK